MMQGQEQQDTMRGQMEEMASKLSDYEASSDAQRRCMAEAEQSAAERMAGLSRS